MTLEEAIAKHRKWREKHPDRESWNGNASAQFMLADAYLAHLDEGYFQSACFPDGRTEKTLCAILLEFVTLRVEVTRSVWRPSRAREGNR